MLYSKEEILKHLKSISWDITYSPEQLFDLLTGKVQSINGFTRTRLYEKIIKGFYWHKVRHIIPEDQLKDALSEEVLVGIFPRALKDKFRHVRSLL